MRFFDRWKRKRELTASLNWSFERARTARPEQGLSDLQKSAIMLMSLPPEASASLFAEISPHEVQLLVLEISGMAVVKPDTRREVLTDFLSRLGIHSSNSGSPPERLATLVLSKRRQFLELLSQSCLSREDENFACLRDHHKLAVLLKSLTFLNRFRLTRRLAAETYEYAKIAGNFVQDFRPTLRARILRELVGVTDSPELTPEAELKKLKGAINDLPVQELLENIGQTWSRASSSHFLRAP